LSYKLFYLSSSSGEAHPQPGQTEQWRRELGSSHAIGQALSSTVLLAARSAVTHHLAVNGEALVGRRM